VSNYHAYASNDELISAPLRAALGTIDALRAAVIHAVVATRTAIVDRWTQRRLARLSNHMLRDLGFERDWDGTVRSLRDAD
jgi:hypothetical protein